ncbi:hypothetical protein IJH89_01335 [Candidatus Saccharibacteria bacterium]|nr:hypothetical protein [Candidatus Saccharibacteria bacterium]
MLTKPERILTDKEWAILSQAAGNTAGDYNVLAGRCFIAGDYRAAKHWAKKANRIYQVLIDLENEYYKAHPEEDPDLEKSEEGK